MQTTCALATLALFVVCVDLRAQAPPATREQEISHERDKKEATLEPETVTKTENFLRNFRDQKYLERFSAGFNGFRVKLGNMVTGGGFAIGPEYYREDLLNGSLTARASAQISTRAYQKYETELIAPKLANSKLQLSLLGSHRNYGGINYYGNGPDSSKSGRSNYRLEDTAVDGILAAKPWRGVKFGTSLGYLLVNVGPGTDDRFVSSDQIYPPSVAPGIDTQTNFLRYGFFAQYDYRDDPNGAKRGGNYVMQFSWFDDQRFNRYSFRRLDIDLQQYIGLFNDTRRFAFRAKAILTDSDGGNVVPFYLRPVLGGSDDLRGFRPFRFSDNNSLILNGEYRWEIFSGLDGALFADGGKVFPRRGQFNFSNLEGSAGFGLRFNARNATFLRVDVGFSHEGFQVWFKFNDVFNQRTFGTTTGQPVY